MEALALARARRGLSGRNRNEVNGVVTHVSQ